MNGDDASRLLEAGPGAELLVHELEAVGGQLPRSHLLLLRLLQEAGRRVLCHHDECCCAGATRQHSPGGCRSWEQRRRREGAREERERGEGHDVCSACVLPSSSVRAETLPRTDGTTKPSGQAGKARRPVHTERTDGTLAPHMFRFTTIHPARLHHLRVPAEDLHHQCGLALLSLLVNRRALVEQQLHQLRVAIGARLHQRGPALLVLLVDRRALIEQQLRQHLRVGLVARHQQRGPTLLSPFSLTDAP